MVRTRVAPAPTGSPHVGTAYQALFDYVVAKKFGGEFILRIEDTDRKRFVEGTEGEIIDALKWLGLAFDEGPIRQSERLDLYRKYAKKLVEVGAAFEDEGAIRQKVPKEGQTKFVDEVRGEVVFENKNLDESVLLKSDGFPTYHLAVVVDDHEMGITHVIRGEEWIPSTPKHVMIYDALSWELPKFIHLPLIRDPQRHKLGKRFGDVSINWFKNEGFLPKALLNYLALMAWTHPEEKEIFDLKEMVEKFDFKNLNKAAPVFDLNKLLWLNGKHIRSLGASELSSKLKESFPSEIQSSKLKGIDEDYLKKIISLVRERMKTLKEFPELTNFFFEEPKIDSGLSLPSSLLSLLTPLKNSDWNAGKLEEICRTFVKANPSWTTKDLFMTLRVALTGSKVSPPLFETMEVLGQKNSLSRLQKAAELCKRWK